MRDGNPLGPVTWLLSASSWLLIALSFVGCAGQQLAPPGMPTIASIQAQAAQLAPITNVGAFYKSGVTLVEMNCGGYFDTAVLNALSAAQTQGEANVLSSAVLGVLGITGVGGAAVSGVGLAAGTLSSLLASNMQNSLAGSDPATLSTLIVAAQEKLIAAEGSPPTAADAYAALYDIYRACSPAGIQSLKEQALAAAVNHLSVTGMSGASRNGLVPARVPHSIRVQ
jgi:hypothetical protein